MRVLFYGNQGNRCYRIARWLRARGIEATLFLPANDSNFRSQPEWEDPSLVNNCPDWIRISRRGFHNEFFPERLVVKESQEHDLIFTAGTYILSALLLKKPVVFMPCGGDLTQLPFRANSIRQEIYSYFYRRRIQNVACIFLGPQLMISAAHLLGVGDRVRSFPSPVDVDKVMANMDKSLLADLERKYAQYDWVFLNPSRKNLDPTKLDYKGSDKFLRAFRRFLDKDNKCKVKLILGMHGKHVREFAELVKNQGLMSYCDFIENLSLPKLHAHMSLQNSVVFDQFSTYLNDTFGGISREALVFGSILVTSTDTKAECFQKDFGNEGCPIFQANHEDEIFNRMVQITSMSKDELQEVRQRSRQWVYETLHWENRIDELIEILEEVVREGGKR